MTEDRAYEIECELREELGHEFFNKGVGTETKIEVAMRDAYWAIQRLRIMLGKGEINAR